MREFDGGATRDDDDDKLDFEGFLNPFVLESFAKYMHRNRQTANGVRNSDNWQAGSIPPEVYIKSAWRHFHHWWKLHRQHEMVDREEALDAINGVLFNAMGYALAILRDMEARPNG